MVSPFLFLTFGKRIHFFTDLVLRMFLVSLSSSKIFWIFPCLFIRLFSLVHFLDLLADFSNSLFFVLRRRLPFLYEGQNLFVLPSISCASDASRCFCCFRNVLCDGLSICCCRQCCRCYRHNGLGSCCRRCFCFWCFFLWDRLCLLRFWLPARGLFSSAHVHHLKFSSISTDGALLRRVAFFVFWDLEHRHDTSVVTSHVNCIVGLRVFAPAVVFSVSQNVVQLFPATFRSVARYLFLRYLLVNCVQRDKILLM